MWAILGDPNRTGRPWTVSEFFATGQEEWSRVGRLLDESDAWPAVRGRFLDFGCGVGRMSRELRLAFRSGIGIDVSERMIAGARTFNPDVEFLVNIDLGLRLVDDSSIDFVYSHIVLQHIRPSLQEVFIAEFMRVLAVDGVAAFQVVTEIGRDRRPVWRRAISRLPRPARAVLRRVAGRATTSGVELEMHAITHERVVRIVEDHHGAIVASPFSNSADAGHNGAIRFFDREAALARVATESGASPILSRFYLVRRERSPS